MGLRNMGRAPDGWWDWSVLICYTAGPWLLLWLAGERRRFRQAVGAGVLYALIASTLDDYGVSLELWGYPEQPIPLLTGNAVWNVLAAAPEAILVSEIALAKPRRLWWWILGLAGANCGAEYFALATTNLLTYPNWSPLLSFPVYIFILWITVWYTRWVWAPHPPWKPPVEGR